MREVCLDTETTGLDPGSGHRIIEIGCIELINHVPSGARFQRCYRLFGPCRYGVETPAIALAALSCAEVG